MVSLSLLTNRIAVNIVKNLQIRQINDDDDYDNDDDDDDDVDDGWRIVKRGLHHWTCTTRTRI